jgi:hypothetical protein
MVKVNGWKRIGIIASVVWILGAGIYILTVVEDADIKTASGLTLSCEEAQNWRGSRECDERATDYLAQSSYHERIDAAVVAFVPLPLGWGFAYLVLFLVRWIKRGFMRPL